LVEQALVTAHELENRTTQLLAYLVPKEKVGLEEIKSFLRERLPSYMVPSIWMELKQFPFNQNGKIDKKALPLPQLHTTTDEMGSGTQLEKALAEIWKGLL